MKCATQRSISGLQGEKYKYWEVLSKFREGLYFSAHSNIGVMVYENLNTILKWV